MMAGAEQELPGASAAPGPEASVPDSPDLSAYAQDLITLWQSELSALAADREMYEGFQRGLGIWSAAAQNIAQNLPKAPVRDPPRRSGSAAPAGAASGPVAPDARDAELARLAERVAELERKLAELSGK